MGNTIPPTVQHELSLDFTSPKQAQYNLWSKQIMWKLVMKLLDRCLVWNMGWYCELVLTIIWLYSFSTSTMTCHFKVVITGISNICLFNKRGLRG